MKKIFSSIDIGSDSIKIVVCEYFQNKLNVLASTKRKSDGIRNGIIVDSVKAKESIKNIMDYCGNRKVDCSDCILGPEHGNFCNTHFMKTSEDWDLRIIKK